MKLHRLAVLFSILFFSQFSDAQTFLGSLRGRVVDPNGAITANAKLTITDEATGVERTTSSNGEGEYTFASVNPATYTVTAEAPGFKKLEQRGVVVGTQGAVTADLQLEIGQITEQVNVTAESAPLETADGSTGQEIDTQKIVDLPILGRNPFFEAKLGQSVVFAANPKMGRMQDQNANSQASIAGGPIRTNNVLVDGISITDSNNRAVFVPSPETVQEVKLQASTYDAEVGRTGGGTFNTTLRSGSNDLHGSAVAHIRQTDWLANNFFSNRSGLPVADQPFRDWAASLGGPVIIPKIYDGRNRTFFFIATEAYRQEDGYTATLSVPTALERQGDFSQSFNNKGTQQTIYDPFSTNLVTGTRSPFPGNVIPLSQQNSVGQKLASYYPLPNAATPYYGAPNYNFSGGYPNRGDQYTFKGDEQFTSWLRVSASYIHQKTGETDAPPTFGNVASPGQTLLFRRIDATQANATATLNPTTVLAIRWGFNRFYSSTYPTSSAGFDLTTLGLPTSLAAVTPNPAFPAVTMGDLTSYGGGTTNADTYYSRSVSATLSKFLGRHSLKAGFDFRTLHDYGIPASGPTSLGFTSVFTQANPQAATSLNGASLATMLLGYPTSGSMSVISRFDDFIRYYGAFIHDDFRVTTKLTLNFGIRFEHESGIQEENNKLIVGFNTQAVSPLQQTAGIPVPGTVEYAGVTGNPTQTGNPLAIKPAPRVGFAYSADNKTVIRGGYGIFWAPSFFNFQNAIGYSQTTSIITSTNGNFTPSATLTNPYPNGLLQPTGNSLGGLSGIGQAITVFSPTSQSAGYVQEYSFEVERQAPAGFVVTAGFLGSHSLHLNESGINVDQLNPSQFSQGSALLQSVTNPFYGNGGVGTIGNPTISRAQLLQPFPQYTSVTLSNADTGSARYYSFFVRAQRRYSNGLSLLASYTWSRSVDDLLGVSTAGTSQITSIAGPQNAYNLGAERALSTQDAPNRFTAALTYELPFGKGKPFLKDSRVLNLIVGGWSANAVGIIQSGFPLAITQTNNNSVIGASVQRPNATGISPETSGSVDSRLNGWINLAAFSPAAQFTFGNVSRFLNLRGPELFNWDLSLFKSFSIRERVKAQFRAEALNATNTPYFGNPNTSISSSTFGLITTQINNSRLLQLGIRVTF